MNMTLSKMLKIHQQIDAEIDSEQRRQRPDVWRLQKMKRIKLSIKDRLFRLGLGRTPSRA